MFRTNCIYRYVYTCVWMEYRWLNYECENQLTSLLIFGRVYSFGFECVLIERLE